MVMTPRPGVWRFVALPDTQYYSRSDPEIFGSQVDWIVEQSRALDIRFVAHLGDIVHNDRIRQWNHAREALEPMLGLVPFAPTIGNHDLAGNADRRSSLHSEYFEWDELGTPEQLGGRMADDLWNTYFLFDGLIRQWLVLSLEFGPRDEVLDWAHQVVEAHPDRSVIVTTHAYLYWDGERFDQQRFGDEQRGNPHNYGIDELGVNDGQELWTKFLSLHANVVMVLCGHTLGDGLAYRASPGIHGNVVHEMLSNYQKGVVHDGVEREASGYLRVLEFDESGRRVRVLTYSPWLDELLVDRDNYFELQI